MTVYYREDLSTLVYPVKGDSKQRISWAGTLAGAVVDLGIGISEEIEMKKKAANRTSQKAQLDLSTKSIEVLKKRGLASTEDAVKEYNTLLARNKEDSKDKVIFAAQVETKSGREAKPIDFWANFTDWPNKAPTYVEGKAVYKQVMKMTKPKDKVKEDESRITYLMPLDTDGRYIFYFPEIGNALCQQAKKGFLPVVCQAYPYDRNAKNKKECGIPKYKPSWLKEQNCELCIYAPHRDTSRDSEYGVSRENACKLFTNHHGFVGCRIEDNPVLVRVNLSLSGGMGYVFMNTPGLKLRPRYEYMVELKNIKKIKKDLSVTYTCEDVTDVHQRPVFTSKDDEPIVFTSIISAAIRDYYHDLLAATDIEAPADIEAPPASTDFEPSQYEANGDDLPDVFPPPSDE